MFLNPNFIILENQNSISSHSCLSSQEMQVQYITLTNLTPRKVGIGSWVSLTVTMVLEKEGASVKAKPVIDVNRHLWNPKQEEITENTFTSVLSNWRAGHSYLNPGAVSVTFCCWLTLYMLQHSSLTLSKHFILYLIPAISLCLYIYLLFRND